MGVLIDLAGYKFNKLKVIKRVDKPAYLKCHDTFWLCRCDCGNEKIIMGSSIRSGASISCGCYRKEKFSLSKGESSANEIYRSYKNHAKKRNIVFKLSKENFLELTKQNCFYCNSSPSNVGKAKRNNGDFIYNGIDRKKL